MTIYNLPLPLRNFIWNSMRKSYEEENQKEDPVETSINNMRAAGSTANKLYGNKQRAS
jgi:hypothetical protein